MPPLQPAAVNLPILPEDPPTLADVVAANSYQTGVDVAAGQPHENSKESGPQYLVNHQEPPSPSKFSGSLWTGILQNEELNHELVAQLQVMTLLNVKYLSADSVKQSEAVCM